MLRHVASIVNNLDIMSNSRYRTFAWPLASATIIAPRVGLYVESKAVVAFAIEKIVDRSFS